jgi:methylmalonyl-CoA mutase, N-terminal domain
MPDKKIYTDSAIEIKEVYTAGDAPFASQIEMPGQFPFTRGVQEDMYRGKLWTMRQYAGFSTAEESNKRYHYLLSQGVMGLSVAFDLPTQIGYDSDHPLAEGEVGKVGVAIDSIEDMQTLFSGIKLHFHDHQCHGLYSALVLRRPGQKAGRRPEENSRHHSE